jgi:DNA polymerase I-like protein with 3'-5' exonuclease and polymerase domains
MDRAGRRFTIVPTIHPAFVARTGFTVAPVMEADIAKAGRWAAGESTWSEPSYDYNPSTAQVEEYVRLVLHNAEGGLDIETPESSDVEEDELSEGGYLPVGLIGLSAYRYHAIGVSPDQFDLLKPLFDRRERRRARLREDVRPTLWAYNAGFDFHHLRRLYELDGIRPADAMMAFYHLRPEMARKDLGTCMSFYTDLPFHKNLQDVEPEAYNAADTYGVLEAGQNMLTEMRRLAQVQSARFPWIRQSIETLFWTHSMPIIPEIGKWGYVGAPYDQELSDRLEYTLRLTLDKYTTWWDANVPHFSWSSPKQLIELFEARGIKVPLVKRTRTSDSKNGRKGQTYYSKSVDDDFLARLIKKGDQTANLVQTMRELRHAGDFLNLGHNGRVYCRAKPHGQVGGRIQTINDNMQTIPEEIAGVSPRDCVVAENRDFDLVVSADYSQIEFWAYAWYSKCKRALEIKESGDYLYAAFYEDIWNEPFFLAGKPRRKEFRDTERTPPWKLLVAKSWPLGFTYGRGVPNPADQGLTISRADAKRIYEGFHRDYPEFRRLHSELIFKAAKYRYLQTVFGRLRRFPNPDGQHNEILAFPGQSTAVDVLIRNVLTRLPRLIADEFGERSHIYFTVHDSAVMNINCEHDGAFSIERALHAHDFVKAIFETPIPEMDDFIFPAEVKLGHSWGQGFLKERLKEKLHARIFTGAV